MKSIFFILIMASSTALLALSNEQISYHDASGKVTTQSESVFKGGLTSKEPIGILSGKEFKKHHNDSNSNFEGPRGPRGEAGPPGSVGNLTRSYGQFFTEEDTTVDPGDPIPFTSTSVSSSRITLLPGGLIQIHHTGDYLVTFGLSTTNVPADGRVALINGTTLVPGTNVTISNADQTTTVATIVHITTVPTTLSVINNDVSSLTLDSAVNRDITAFISVLRLHELPTP